MSKLSERLQRRRAEIRRDARREKLILFAVVVGFTLAALFLYFKTRQPAGFGGPLDLNSASISQLDKLPEIGPAMAKEIVQGRPYEKVEDLLEIKGIGPKTLEKIREHVEIEKK